VTDSPHNPTRDDAGDQPQRDNQSASRDAQPHNRAAKLNNDEGVMSALTIEEYLAAMTAPSAAAPKLWLAASRRDTTTNTHSAWTRPLTVGSWPVAAALLVGSVVFISAMLPTLGKARSSSRSLRESMPSVSEPAAPPRERSSGARS
jgi:hypothetical protein